MTTYYVSSIIGSDGNAGTSATAPFATLQVAANHTAPGDTVLVMNGTYTGGAGADVVDITTSGTASAPITFMAAPGQTPVIDSSDCWNAINITASYIVIDGFTVVGNAATITQQDALANSSPGNAHYDGNGISVTADGNVPNHITIKNNTVYNEPGGGIGSQGADYLQILNNTVYNNAHWSAYGTSGISIASSVNSDTAAGAHIVISGNLVYGNAELVPEYRANAITDGEGIILDSNQGYTGGFLVQNNVVHDNGSAGIEAFLTANAVITGNTIYGNNTQQVQSNPSAFQIFINQSNNVTVTDNNFNPNDDIPPLTPAITGDIVDGDVVTLTGTAEPNSTVTVSDNSTQLGTTLSNANGQWTFTTGELANGSQSFTATATDVSLNMSAPSSPLVVVVNSQVNLVVNGGFETGNFNGWTLSGNITSGTLPAIFITNHAQGGHAAAGLGSMGSDGTLSQNIQTTAGQHYTLDFWLANEVSGGNDFTVKWNGQTLLALVNASAQGFTEYTYDVVGIAGTSRLEFDAQQNPSQWDLDSISVTAAGSQAPATATPVISSYSSDTGTQGDGITNDKTLTLSGTAGANDTVKVLDGTALLGTTTANGSGAWSYTTSASPDGKHTFTITDTNSSGNTSAPSSALVVTVDTTAPARPVVSSFSPDSGTTGDGHTTATTLTLTGSGEANSTVQVFDGTKSVGTASVNASGTWSITASNLAVGSHSFTATDTDVAGNASVASAPFSVTIDASSSPPPPAMNLVVNGGFETGNFSGWTLSGNITWGTLPEIFITSHAQSGHTAAGLGSMGSDGTLSQNIQTTAGQHYTLDFWLANEVSGGNDFTVKWNGQTLLALVNASAQGFTEYTYDVVGTAGTSHLEFDAQQNPSQWDLDSISVTPITSSPSTLVSPVIASFSPDTGVVGDGITDPAVLTLTGTAVAGSTVRVFDGNTLLGTATANGSGAWSYTTIALPDGKHNFTATDTNAAGSTSAPSSVFSVTVDTVAPAQPKISSFTPDTSPTNDGHTTATILTLAGTGEANSTVQVFDGTKSLGTAPVNGNGAWNFTANNLTVGGHSFTATDADAAGNTSVASAPLAVTIDALSSLTQPTSPIPSAPVIASFSTDSGIRNDGITNDKTLTLTGAAGANDTVKVFDGTTLLGTASVNSSGNWSYTTKALPDGKHTFTSTDTNSAGSTSAPSSALVVTVDTSAPARPTFSSFSPDTTPTGDGQTTATNLTLSGKGEANSTIQLFDGTSLLGSAPVNAAGNWSIAANNLAVGSHSFSATDTDAAGNTSLASAQLALTILSQMMAGQTGQTGSSGGTTISSPPSTPQSDPPTLANPFGLVHA